MVPPEPGAGARDLAADPIPEALNDVPRVVITTPCYGPVTVGYMQAFSGASQDRELLRIVGGIQSNSSLLPTAFNDCLAQALNWRDRGRVTHLAMLHSDVAADRGWLDVLWSEMWIHGADMISAVVPIKAPGGRTSTAIGRADDRWTVRRCLYLDELADLPPTFGPEHVCLMGEVLLVNTGCWLADLRHPFWDWFAAPGPGGPSGFNILSRMVYRPTAEGDSEWTCETRSEDWELSHDMHEFGMRYMATSRVKLWHEGGGRWPNHAAEVPHRDLPGGL